MKRKIILAFAVVALLGLSIAAVAYTRSGTVSRAASHSCCTGDSCPMKNKTASTGEKMSCCDNCDCCDGDSCPMKHSAEKTSVSDSCPMKNKGEKAAETTGATATDKKTGCDCSCCNHETKTKDAAV